MGQHSAGDAERVFKRLRTLCSVTSSSITLARGQRGFLAHHASSSKFSLVPSANHPACSGARPLSRLAERTWAWQLRAELAHFSAHGLGDLGKPYGLPESCPRCARDTVTAGLESMCEAHGKAISQGHRRAQPWGDGQGSKGGRWRLDEDRAGKFSAYQTESVPSANSAGALPESMTCSLAWTVGTRIPRHAGHSAGPLSELTTWCVLCSAKGFIQNKTNHVFKTYFCQGPDTAKGNSMMTMTVK